MAMAMDNTPSLPATFFAPPERAGAEELRAQIAAVAANPIVDAILAGLGGVAVIVNRQRQILAINAAYLEQLGLDDPAGALGLRPGEALGCVHAHDHPAGCGTARVCESCGAAVAMVTSLRHERAEERECALLAMRGAAPVSLDLRVRALPLRLESHGLLLVLLDDVSESKRCACLEQAFFHDLNNVLVGLLDSCAEVSERLTGEHAALAAELHQLAARVAREVAVQRALALPGSRLRVDAPQRAPIAALLAAAADTARRHPSASGRRLGVASTVPGSAIETDPVLLQRVLLNLLLNALEASPADGEVRLWVEDEPARVVFKVWNQGAIPPAVAPRIFQRYFSTKTGPARGQGTYAAKLLGERYLGGHVGFRSDEPGGTLFWIELPRGGG